MQLPSVFKATQNANFVIYVTLFSTHTHTHTHTHTQLVSLVNVILFQGANDYEV